MASSSRGDEFFTPTSSRLEPSHWAPEGLEILVFYATTTLSRNCENLVPERQDSCSSVGAARSQWSISEKLILKIDSFHPQKWKQLKLSTMIKADIKEVAYGFPWMFEHILIAQSLSISSNCGQSFIWFSPLKSDFPVFQHELHIFPTLIDDIEYKTGHALIPNFLLKFSSLDHCDLAGQPLDYSQTAHGAVRAGQGRSIVAAS